jgi:hypothetical protein
MWIVVLLTGVVALIAVAWRASRGRGTGPATGTGNADIAGDGASSLDGTASHGITPDCTDATSDGGGCDGGGGGGD